MKNLKIITLAFLLLTISVKSQTCCCSENVNVQKLADNSIKTVEFADGSRFWFFLDAGIEKQFLVNTFKEGGAQSSLGVGSAESRISSTDASGAITSSFITNQGYASIESAGSLITFPAFGFAQIAFPDLPYGNYTVSVAKTYSDPTNIVKSSTTLNVDYPNALPGDKVQALSIISGALIYEKTATGWVQTPVTVTP